MTRDESLVHSLRHKGLTEVLGLTLIDLQKVENTRLRVGLGSAKHALSHLTRILREEFPHVDDSGIVDVS